MNRKPLVWLVLGVSGLVCAETVSSRPKARAASAKAAAKPAAEPAADAIPQAVADAFKQNVTPVLTKTCSQCHNDRLASGGMNLLAFTDPKTFHSSRTAWETILRQVRGGEMPPRGLPRPAQTEVDAFAKTIEDAFDRIDKSLKPDPGRVTARRLNRSEYSNTVRDLLGVEFRADRTFPTDDSGEGFDNIADVLTISPLLMEKYLNAAERIATRALALETLPKPVETPYSMKAAVSGALATSGSGSIRRLGPSAIEVTHRFEFDGEYTLRVGLPGDRGAQGKPVKMNVWVDGQLATSREIETKPSGLVY